MKYICPHYGFGDYVIVYGLIKELSKSDDITLFVRSHRSELQIENIRRLYKSISNVTISTEDPDIYKHVLYLGWEKYAAAIIKDPYLQFQKFFYDQAGVSLNLLWDNFYFERDLEKEENIFLSLELDKEYIFLHDDPSRNFTIDRTYLKTSTAVFRLGDYPNISILDTLTLVENAVEVHMSNTGLVSFVDQMKIKHGNLNYHRYTRPLPFEQPILKLNWKIWTK
jgi:hypothetical protein